MSASSAAELSSFGYFQRSSIKEMLTFGARTLATSVAPGERKSVKLEGFFCHVYGSASGVTAACVADAEYPSRVAFAYLSKLCEDFVAASGGRLSARRMPRRPRAQRRRRPIDFTASITIIGFCHFREI